MGVVYVAQVDGLDSSTTTRKVLSQIVWLRASSCISLRMIILQSTAQGHTQHRGIDNTLAIINSIHHINFVQELLGHVHRIAPVQRYSLGANAAHLQLAFMGTGARGCDGAVSDKAVGRRALGPCTEVWCRCQPWHWALSEMNNMEQSQN